MPEKENGLKNVKILKKKETLPEYLLDLGRIYMTTDEGKAYKIFADMVHHGTPGLALTTKRIDSVKEQYHLKKTPVIQLNGSTSREGLNPELKEHSEMIPYMISDFIHETNEAVIIIHAPENWLYEPVKTNIPKTMFYSTYHLDKEFDKPTIYHILDEIDPEIKGRASVLIVVSKDMEMKIQDYTDVVHPISREN